VILKTDVLTQVASSGLRLLTGQSTDLASHFDIRWLGFSYLAFRLLHTLRDRMGGRLPDLSLGEFVVFMIFFPAYTAGPIDRIQRFKDDLRRDFRLDASRGIAASRRILIGVFKKFVLADSLALMALNEVTARQTTSPLWMWALLYAYSFRLYFDFGGYTDIAIGIGELIGFTLPENFDRPYLKTNLTTFWNSWHITLAQWFRGYFYYPITRSLLTAKRRLPIAFIIFVGQMGTMLLIGLWHGITWNFILWGAWHGVGLFIHNRWVDFLKVKFSILPQNTGRMNIASLGGTLLTFQFVALGWVWFALPTPELSWQAILTLFGL
jgi:D-alanyl-lipoteichoic acid acyltransferase DltB (MBOAT superfamily)